MDDKEYNEEEKKEGEEKESKKEKQEAYSQGICQSERGFYLDGVILLFVKLYRESFPCWILHLFLTAVEHL